MTSPQYDFTSTQDWFSFNTSVWGPLLHQLRSTLDHPPRALEIGSWEGRSAVFLLETFCNTHNSELVCIDHFDLHQTPAGRERFDKIQRNLSIVGHPFRVIDEFSAVGLYRLLEEEIETPKGGFDFVYIDGSHEADDTFLDAELAWRLTRRGALVIFDDYEWTTEPPESMHHPKRGIDGFLTLHKDEYEVVHRGYQIIIRKTSEMRIGFLTKKSGNADLYEDAPINVALCSDSAYAMPTAVSIRSAIEACVGRRMSFYVVDCGLSNNDKDRLIRSLSPYNDRVTLNFIELAEDSRGRREATWAKVDALSLLPVERVLLLDSDVLVLHDLGKLWKLDLKGKTFAAARDIGYPLGHDGVQRGPYFNAGVLLIDMTLIRARLPALLEFIDTRLPTVHKDQDALNDFFRKEWFEMSVEWNATGLGTYASKESEDRSISWPNGELKNLEHNAKIVHFTGPVHPSMSGVLDEYNQPWTSKPWGFAGAPGHPFAGDWYRILRKTSWAAWFRSKEFTDDSDEAQRRIIDQGTELFRERVAVGRDTFLAEN